MGRPLRIQGRPDKPLSQSQDVKSYRQSERDSGKGDPHLLLPFRAEKLTRSPLIGPDI
jgi:hypothetical protein